MKNLKSNLKFSPSAIKLWEDNCHRLFEEIKLKKSCEFPTTEAMMWGRAFEQACLKQGQNEADKIFLEDNKKSVNIKRIALQAEVFEKIIAERNIKIENVQQYVNVSLFHSLNADVRVELTLSGIYDFTYKTNDGKLHIVDLKFTKDCTTEWGDFAWGSPFKMDLIQAKHYLLMEMLNNGGDCIFEYWIFDYSPEPKARIYECDVAMEAIEFHKNRIIKMFEEVTLCTDSGFPCSSKYMECLKCPVQKCEGKRYFPEIENIKINQ